MHSQQLKWNIELFFENNELMMNDDEKIVRKIKSSLKVCQSSYNAMSMSASDSVLNILNILMC